MKGNIMKNKTLKIGGHRYKVIYTDIRSKLDSDNCAKIDREKGIIYVDKTLMKSEREQSLMHEIVHLINGEISEELTDSLSQQLYQVFTENNLFGD